MLRRINASIYQPSRARLALPWASLDAAASRDPCHCPAGSLARAGIARRTCPPARPMHRVQERRTKKLRPLTKHSWPAQRHFLARKVLITTSSAHARAPSGRRPSPPTHLKKNAPAGQACARGCARARRGGRAAACTADCKLLSSVGSLRRGPEAPRRALPPRDWAGVGERDHWARTPPPERRAVRSLTAHAREEGTQQERKWSRSLSFSTRRLECDPASPHPATPPREGITRRGTSPRASLGRVRWCIAAERALSRVRACRVQVRCCCCIYGNARRAGACGSPLPKNASPSAKYMQRRRESARKGRE